MERWILLQPHRAEQRYETYDYARSAAKKILRHNKHGKVEIVKLVSILSVKRFEYTEIDEAAIVE